MTMRRSLALAVSTWLLAFALRAFARAELDTLENPRHLMSPPFSWVGSGSVEIPVVTTIIVLFTLYATVLAWWRLRPTRLAATGLGLFVGGAAANTTERLAFGAVTDYIPIAWPDTYLANFADLAILTGAIVLASALLHSCALRYTERRGKRERQDSTRSS